VGATSTIALKLLSLVEAHMKPFRIAGVVLAGLFAASSVLLAQETPVVEKPHHSRYKFIDLGTLGGPDSIVPFGEPVLNSRGSFVANSDTATPDPFAPICFYSPNCFVNRAFKWEAGVITPLEPLGPGAESEAHAINERGVAAGMAQTGEFNAALQLPVAHAVIWKNGQVIDLGTLGGSFSGVLGINNADEAAGISFTNIPDPTNPGFPQLHAFVWTQGKMIDLGTLGGPFSFGTAINDLGQSGGISLTAPDPDTGESQQRAFIWERGQMRDLGTLGGTYSDGLGLNNKGQAVGTSTLPGDLELHTFLRDKGKMNDVGTLGGTFSSPTGLTDNGHISGQSTTANDEALHGFLWRDGKMTDLGTLPGDDCSNAWGLNSKDQVVGLSGQTCDDGHAFLWENGSMVDLNTLIPAGSSLELVYAEHINERGEILGIGVPAGVKRVDVETKGHVFVLIPTEDYQDGLSTIETATPTLRAGDALNNEQRRARAHAAAQRMMQKYLRMSHPTSKHLHDLR